MAFIILLIENYKISLTIVKKNNILAQNPRIWNQRKVLH